MGGHPGRQLMCDEDRNGDLGFAIKSTAESRTGYADNAGSTSVPKHRGFSALLFLWVLLGDVMTAGACQSTGRAWARCTAKLRLGQHQLT